jgi:hypothetical protein
MHSTPNKFKGETKEPTKKTPKRGKTSLEPEVDYSTQTFTEPLDSTTSMDL